jgi:predicted ribosome quality control (RQC) complex YloA/Tae2 family protein
MVAKFGDDLTATDVYNYVNDGNLTPCITYVNGEPNDFKAKYCGDNAKYYPTLLEAQTEYYSYVYNKNTFEDKKRKLLSALSAAQKKSEKRLAQIQEKLLECNSADLIKLKGELITANIYAIQRGQTSFEAVNYYDENCGKIKIDLDRQLTPSQNAQKYYKKYAKLKRTQENLTEQKKEIEERHDYLKSIEGNIYAAEELYDLTDTQEELTELGLIKKVEEKGKKKKVKEVTPYRLYNVNGFKVVAGRNNVQNDSLVKGLSGEDMWLHTQKFHSSHVAIIAEGRAIPDDILLIAARICAYYSEARERDKVSVDYTQKRFVKKPSKANLGFVIYTDYKTIIVTPNAHAEYREN